MFLSLLAVTLVVATAVSTLIVLVFDRPAGAILRHLVGESLSRPWHLYLRFAVLVTGISCGAPVWNLEKYVVPRDKESQALVLDAERWVLEVYRTLVDTAQGAAGCLFVFFLVALAAYVILRRRGPLDAHTA